MKLIERKRTSLTVKKKQKQNYFRYRRLPRICHIDPVSGPHFWKVIKGQVAFVSLSFAHEHMTMINIYLVRTKNSYQILSFFGEICKVSAELWKKEKSKEKTLKIVVTTYVCSKGQLQDFWVYLMTSTHSTAIYTLNLCFFFQFFKSYGQLDS